MNEPKLYDSKILNRKEIAEDTFELELGLQNDFNFQAGQYIWLILPNLLYEDPRGQRRAFSICSSPNKKGLIDIIFRKSASGFKKTLIELPINSYVQVYGPFGSMILPQEPPPLTVLIAGGTGIAPFLSIIRFATEQEDPRKILLIYSNVSKNRAAYFKNLKELQSKNPNFSFKSNISKLKFNFIKESVPNLRTAKYYVIGPQEMISNISKGFSAYGINPESIIFEEFYVPSKTPEVLLSNIEVFKMAVESASNHIVFTDTNGVIMFANHGAEETTLFTKNEMIGQTPRLWGGLMDGEFYRKLWRTIKIDLRPFVGEIKNRRKNGEIYYAIARISPIFDSKSSLIGFMATEEDISTAKEIDRQKSEFISITSHQLRTPMSISKWVIELLLEYKNLTELQKDRLKDLYQSNERLINLLNDLLMLSRVESKRLFENKTKINILSLVKSCIVSMKKDSGSKGQKINLSTPKTIHDVNIISNLLTEALNNILMNAVNYGASNSVITVAIQRNKNEYIISVNNKGSIIPESERDKIFTKFFRGLTARATNTTGSGLGLFIAKNYIESNGGKIWFDSNKKDGTTFYFTVPISQ